MKPLVSIVVPVYNVEGYITDCIKSLLAQTYSKIDIILVDDGSNDSSGRICDKYAEKYNNIKVIHTLNSGVTSARHTGVINSSGEYITFIDSDDTLIKDAIEYMVDALKDGNPDIVFTRLSYSNRLHNGLYPIEQVRSDIIAGGVRFHPGPCAKLYHRKLFDKHVFEIPREIVKGEDMLMNIRILFKTTSSIAYRSRQIYNYRIRAGSATKTFQFNPDYEIRFNQLELESIPKEYRSQYRGDLLIANLKSFSRSLSTKLKIPASIVASQYYKYIVQEIHSVPIKGYYVEKGLLLNLKNRKRLIYTLLYSLHYFPERIYTRFSRKLKSMYHDSWS